jgi:hypothetical protein
MPFEVDVFARKFFEKLFEPLQAGWGYCRDFFHGLRIAFIPFASVLIGFWLLATVPQAQDFFLEMRGDYSQGFLWWLSFYLFAALVWILPVYFSADWILRRYNGLENRRRGVIPVEPWVKRRLPPFLATLCVVAILVGQWNAILESPRTFYECTNPLGRKEDCRDKELILSSIIQEANNDFLHCLLSSKAACYRAAAVLDKYMPGNSKIRGNEEANEEARGDKPEEQKTLSFQSAIDKIKLWAPVAISAIFWMLTVAACLGWGILAASRVNARLAHAPLRSRFLSGLFWPLKIAVWLCAALPLLLPLVVLAGAYYPHAPFSQHWFGWLWTVNGYLNWLAVPSIGYLLEQNMQTFITEAAYYHLGAPAFALFITFILILLTLALLGRRIPKIEDWGLRLCWRLTLLQLYSFVLLAIYLGWFIGAEWFQKIQKEIQEQQLSLYPLMLLPLVSLMLVFAAWTALNRASKASAGLLEGDKAIRVVFLAIAMLSGFLIIGFILLDPIFITKLHIQRALLIPFLLGLWIPLVTWLTFQSYRTGVPFLLLAIIFLGLRGWVFGDVNEVRTEPMEKGANISRPPLISPPPLESGLGAGRSLSKSAQLPSIDQWKKANACETPAGGQPQECPKPIIVLASGGASRSAFMVATVLGDLMDLSESHRGEGVHPFHERLFAISSVSGGSLAAVTFRAALELALAEGSDGSVKPPCKTNDEPLWFGYNDKSKNPASSWKDCLQILTAGDFLSPPAIAMAVSDLTAIRRYGDRAAILEQAWERHFSRITGLTPGQGEGLEEELVAGRNSALARAPAAIWLPHLVLNGTSVATGRRIITTDLDPFIATTSKKKNCPKEESQIKTGCGDGASGSNQQNCPKVELRKKAGCGDEKGVRSMFGDAYDLYGMLNCIDGPCIGRNDVRLSTAVTMTARFPVVSPHGAIFGFEHQLVDRVVDGGYFENHGAIAARELAEALKQQGLDPVILLITNEPAQQEILCTEDATAPPYPSHDENANPFLFTSPMRAFLGTRTAHGTNAAAKLCEYVSKGQFFHIRVLPDSYMLGAKQLSMSWWLSKHVQLKLDSSTDQDKEAMLLGIPLEQDSGNGPGG